MNWATHPIFYQMTHWWHWLTYGQNTAALGLIGLCFYTYYTQRMMKAAEETRRLSLTPFLVAEVRTDLLPPSILVTNVAAPAVRCELWIQPVSSSFKPGSLRLVRAPGVSSQYIPAILSGSQSPVEIEIALKPGLGNFLYVIDCHDTAGGKYQLQLLQASRGDGDAEELRIGNVFLVPDTLYPLHRVALNRVKQLWELRKLTR